MDNTQISYFVSLLSHIANRNPSPDKCFDSNRKIVIMSISMINIIVIIPYQAACQKFSSCENIHEYIIIILYRSLISLSLSLYSYLPIYVCIYIECIMRVMILLQLAHAVHLCPLVCLPIHPATHTYSTQPPTHLLYSYNS